MAKKAKAPPPDPRQINQKAMEVATEREKSLDQMQQKIDNVRSSYSLSEKDAKRVEELQKQVDTARDTLAKEKELRQAIDDTYAKSEYKKPDADPAVKDAMKALNDHKKGAAKGLYANKSGVADPIQPCMEKELSRVKDLDTPYWVTTQYGSGPTYPVSHKHTLATYEGWDEMIEAKRKTQSEKNVIVAMSANEGDLDSVQAWDDQVASLGAMQKTIRPGNGEGELSDQLLAFKESDPEKYTELFEDKGWTVREDEIPPKKKGGQSTYQTRTYYKDPNDEDAKERTGKDLKKYINDPKDPDRWKRVLGPLHEAGQDPAFQKRQAIDFNDRLVGAMQKKPKGHSGKIEDYLSSERGATMVLDQDVNRPGWVADDFGTALDKFYKANPKAPKDPSTWTEEQRKKYEAEILKSYKGTRRLNDKEHRTKVLEDSTLSDSPGSLQWPETPVAPA